MVYNEIVERDKAKTDVKRKPTRNARQYADRIARTATERADSTEPPRTLTPTAKKESAPHQPTKATARRTTLRASLL